MDATCQRPERPERSRRRRRRRHRRGRSQSPAADEPSPSPSPPSSPPLPPRRSDSESASAYVTQYVENKMGLPPPYEQSQSNPAPPPSYFGNNPPPPAGFVAPAVAPRTTVITGPAPSAPGPVVKLGPGPTGTTCASCNRTIVTRVDYVPNNRTHIVSAALCVLAGCCCGCFVPYCMRSCKTANHYCPKCRAFVGSYMPS